MNYALLKNGIVTNIIVLAPYNASEFPNAVPLGDIPAGIGDRYRDGKFYRDSMELLSPREQEVRALEQQHTADALALAASEQKNTALQLHVAAIERGI